MVIKSTIQTATRTSIVVLLVFVGSLLPTLSWATERGVTEAQVVEIVHQRVKGKILKLKSTPFGYRVKLIHRGKIRIIYVDKTGTIVKRPEQ